CGLKRAWPSVYDGRQLVGIAAEDLFSVIQGFVFVLGDKRGGNKRRTGMFDQAQRNGMIGHAYAYGLARRMRHTARHFARSLEYEGPGAGCCHFKEAVLPVVDTRKMAYFGQVAAQQGKMMAFVQPAQATQ